MTQAPRPPPDEAPEAEDGGDADLLFQRREHVDWAGQGEGHRDRLVEPCRGRYLFFIKAHLYLILEQ